MGVLDSPSSTIRARYRYIEDGFPRSICSSRPVDISTSRNPYQARFPELDLLIEGGWHIELDKLVSSLVAQKIKLTRNGGTHCYLHTTVLITECQIQLFHWTFPSHGNTAMLCWLWKKTDFMFIAVFWGCCPKYSPWCLLETPLKQLDGSHFFLSKAIILG